MAMDPDFSTFTLLVNTAGSWAKVGRFDLVDEQKVKDACLVLAEKAKFCPKFKTVDAEGRTVEVLNYQGGNGYLWRKY